MDTFFMQLGGAIGSHALDMSGQGLRDTNSGLVDGRYRMLVDGLVQRALPDLNHWVFNALIITGYPSESRCIGAVVNPFKYTPYTYKRRLDFGVRGALTLDVKVEFSADGGELKSEFVVCGDVNLPALCAVEPTIESWVPQDGDQIDGLFNMTWRRTDGGRLSAVATTEYHVPGKESVIAKMGKLHRWIEIEAHGDLHEFTRKQSSTLFATPSFC